MENTNSLMNSPQRTTPRDFFLHLGMMVALYAVAGNFISLLFKVIGRAFPEMVTNGYYWSQGSEISLPVATLIIVFPIFLLLSKFIYKTYEQTPEKKNLWIRRWLTYVTLFFAGIFLTGDLVTILYKFLDGQDLTAAFLLKALTVLIVSGAIFGFYLQDIRDKVSGRARKVWAIVAGVIITISIIVGFSVLGSPKTQRLLREDNQTINDLQNIQWQVINYWQVNGLIPEEIPNLPERIDYQKTGLLNFRLCAQFNLANKGGPVSMERVVVPEGPYYKGGMTANDNWDHSAGEQCFSRAIDPIKYPTQIRG